VFGGMGWLPRSAGSRSANLNVFLRKPEYCGHADTSHVLLIAATTITLTNKPLKFRKKGNFCKVEKDRALFVEIGPYPPG